MKTNTTCPNCGKPLAEGALDGLCPECMLKVGAVADSVPEPGVGPNGTVVVDPPGASPLASPEIGHEFGGYRVLRRLGHGGMGVVYEAEEKESGRRVALKVINQRLTSPADRSRFLREGRLAASINHPNCVYVFGTDEVEGMPVIVMEFVSGGTLQQQFSEEGPLPVGRAVDAMLQVIEGLEAAQAVGILHRDIKPSNCFQDALGTVKIGDFGLSLSTVPREETHITESGVMVGTPAFCSPEQHRGEELDARTDMFAVGVTLYYLLTGKLPFDGQTMPQLIANTLEKRAQSPRHHRKEIPQGLARAILRCLNKQPTERFKSYADLRRALEPYGSTAPTPATLGLRFLAGMLDSFALSATGQIALLLIFGDALKALDYMPQDMPESFVYVAPWLLVAILYYALCEWRWGATLGKAICRVRVVGRDNSYPSLPTALSRAGLYMVLPMLPYWLTMGVNPEASPMSGEPLSLVMSLVYYIVLGLLFVTVRRRNGFAAVHDLITGTRVVSRTAATQRSALPVGPPKPANVEDKPQVGPYHVLEPLGQSAEAEWVMGYDLRLLRRVLIRKVPPGTPPLPQSQRHHSRAGRLRWLTGRREGSENWDAFEGAAGQSFATLARQPQPWAQVRFWLHDLAEELAAAEREGTIPEVLALDRVWITAEGRAKLLDFPAPGTAGPVQDKPGASTPPKTAGSRARTFLHEVAVTALSESADTGQLSARISVRLSLHARKFLETLPSLKGADAIASALRPLLRRAAEVTRLRRTVIVAACLVFPLFMSAGAMFGVSLMRNLQQQDPELIQLSDLLNTWKTAHAVWMPRDKLPSDEQFGIYIATHYSEVITNESRWSGTVARMFITSRARTFAENSLVEFGAPTPQQLAEAEAALKPIVEQRTAASSLANGGQTATGFWEQPGLPAVMVWGALLFYVGLPAMIAALLFRGGLVLLSTGVTHVRRDGKRASRLRLFWRSLVCWSPVIGAVVLSVIAVADKSLLLTVLSMLLVIALVVWSLIRPQRGLQDVLAGTWPVPR